MLGYLVSWFGGWVLGLGFFFFVLVGVGWVAEGFCEFSVTCKPEFARGYMGEAAGRDCPTQRRN